MGSKPELTNAVGDSYVGDFACKLLVACAPGLGCSSNGEQMNLLATLSKVSCDGGGQLSSCRALKARLQLPDSDLCTALVQLVFQVGFLGVVCCRCSMWA